MPIIKPISNLAKIKRAFGSDTTTAGSTNISKVVGVDKDLNTSKLPRTIFLDLKGDEYPRFWPSMKFQTPVDRSNSRLEIMWDDRKKGYYEQAKGKGELGYRNNDVTGFDQPFIIRDIGDRWGKYDSFGLGDTKFGNTIEGVIKFGAGLIDSIGGAVLGRTPSDYIGSALGSLERTGKFLLTPQGVSFLAKQSVLMGRNKQEFRTDVRYGLTSNLLKLSENTRKYNPISLASLPGVTKININRPDPNLIISPYMNTIASYISDGALSLAQSVGSIIKGFGGAAVDLVGGLVGAGLSKFRINPKVAPGFIDLGRKLQGQFDKMPTPDLEAIKEQARQFGENTKKIFAIGTAVMSKKTSLAIPNAKILSEVGIDKVNMIPYGDRDRAKTPDRKTEEEIDFIPFRFEDMNGNLIVFRAILSAITDAFTPNYAEQKYIGRPDKVYTYTGTDRLVSFTFDIYPKSDQELVRLWEKMNFLAGLTYPEWAPAAGGGAGMIAPFCKLTIGDMFKDTPGYISGLTYTVQDTTTWETVFAKLPKYIQAQCTFVYIGKRLPSSTQKQYEVPWIAEEKHIKEYGDLRVKQPYYRLVNLLESSEKLGNTALAEIKKLPFGTP